MKKIITTRVHGILDYSIAILMLALPWLLRFEFDSVARNVTASTGLLIFVYSLFTNYELGAAHFIPMRVHLGIDVFIALFTIVSPWAMDSRIPFTFRM